MENWRFDCSIKCALLLRGWAGVSCKSNLGPPEQARRSAERAGIRQPATRRRCSLARKAPAEVGRLQTAVPAGGLPRDSQAAGQAAAATLRRAQELALLLAPWNNAK